MPTGKDPKRTSFGDVSIQILHVARMEGKDPTDPAVRRAIIKDLENEAYNLDVVARHLKDILTMAHPDHAGGTLSERQIELLGDAFNLGYPHRLLGPGKTMTPEQREKTSNYGPDLVKKLGRMRDLLR